MDGIIIINKQEDYTSNDVVQIVKKIFKQKAGHAGTLDPMATGVLPILVGKGTKCSKYLVNHDKTYTATLKLGIKTNTGDITGNIVKEEKVENLNHKYVSKILQRFIGKQKQIPPMYSAIKINGKKLYEYAREKKEVDLEPRNIKIYSMELISIVENLITFEVSCSKGTYIRTLCEDIAKCLGTIGTMQKLNREKVGDFSIQNSVTLKELEENFENKTFLDKYFISIEKLLKNSKEIVLSSSEFDLFINGAKVHKDLNDGIYKIYDLNKKFLGTGKMENGVLKRDVIL